jgi:hypothetical protein
MEEADPRHLESDPGEDHLEDQQAEQDQCVPDAMSRDQRHDQEDQAEQDDEVAEPRVDSEDVLEPILADRAAVGVLRHRERAVAGEADLDDDGEEHEPRQVLVDRSHGTIDLRRVRACARRTLRLRPDDYK